MFDDTLEAQTLHLNERKLGTLTVAMAAHAGVLLAVGLTAALSMPRPPHVPDPPHDLILVFRPPVEPSTGSTPPRPPRPPKGGGEGKREAPVPPPPIEVPATVPDRLPDPVDDPGDGAEGTVGDSEGEGAQPGIPGAIGDGVGTIGDGEGSGPVVLTGEMIPPRLLAKVDPEYPSAARIARMSGKVVLQAVIGLDGSVESAEVLHSTSVIFDEAALRAVRLWRYEPARMDGRPVRVYFTVVVTFVVR